jgi:transcriptional regulator with XRE-family HTH domain
LADASTNLLGEYLRGRRAKLDPAAFGMPLTRRRVPGLRREEVAQRANVSATWYTWLEQGRGGAPSAEVLDRISRALMLTDAEREHVFHLALGRAPEVHYRVTDSITPRMQRVLDALPASPAFVKNFTWDVLAWNRAAAAVLGDYASLEPRARNVLRLIFSDSHVRASQTDWESVARFAVASFRADAARAGASREVQSLVDELCRLSPEFERIWGENDVRHGFGEATKYIRKPRVGLIALEYSAFSVEGRPDLSMVVYNPASPADAERVATLIAAYGRPSGR